MPSNPTAVAPLLLSAREAARVLSISERTLWGLSSPRGPIPRVRLGGRVLYSPEALRKWIGEQQEPAP
jgi:predicted DNA-binding transcriptional regulator AlpA